MKIILVIFVILNLMISQIGTVIADENDSPIQVEVLTYKIGDRPIETVVSKDAMSNIVSIEPKNIELKEQPILNINSELSSDKQERKIILKLNIENIGDKKARNVEIRSNPETDVEPLYIKGGRVSDGGIAWTGEIDVKESQELIYELNYNGKGEEDLKIPLTIIGSGSDDWIIDMLIIVLKWWLMSEFGIDIPIGVPTPGFEIIFGFPILISVSYMINKRFKNYKNRLL